MKFRVNLRRVHFVFVRFDAKSHRVKAQNQNHFPSASFCNSKQQKYRRRNDKSQKKEKKNENDGVRVFKL